MTKAMNQTRSISKSAFVDMVSKYKYIYGRMLEPGCGNQVRRRRKFSKQVLLCFMDADEVQKIETVIYNNYKRIEKDK